VTARGAAVLSGTDKGDTVIAGVRAPELTKGAVS
jgi:hypothetical protein